MTVKSETMTRFAGLFSAPDVLLAKMRALSPEARAEIAKRAAGALERKEFGELLEIIVALVPAEPIPQPLTDEQLRSFRIVHGHCEGHCVTCALLTEVARLKAERELESWGGDEVLKLARATIRESRYTRVGFVSEQLVLARAVVRLATGKDWDS